MWLDRHGLLRPDWEARVRGRGLVYADTVHPDGVSRRYWDESHSYVLTATEVNHLEAVTEELHRICLIAAQHVVAHRRYHDLGIPDALVPAIEATWEADAPSIYGRLDLSWPGGLAPPKLLEYNADTPTGLIEAAITQYDWLGDCFANGDQWNSLHERLIARWAALAAVRPSGVPVHFLYTTADPLGEDMMTVCYLADTAMQAALRTVVLAIDDLGYDVATDTFVDLEDTQMRTAFKLYPWEWLYAERDGMHVLDRCGQGVDVWIEPAWKLLLSSKGLLAVLWELFPAHPNLLPAYLGTHPLSSYVTKPLFGREGRGVRVVAGNVEQVPSTSTNGRYTGGYVTQALALLPDLGAGHICLGSWLIDGHAAGLGIRESMGPVTDNVSRFVPHRIEDPSV